MLATDSRHQGNCLSLTTQSLPSEHYISDPVQVWWLNCAAWHTQQNVHYTSPPSRILSKSHSKSKNHPLNFRLLGLSPHKNCKSDQKIKLDRNWNSFQLAKSTPPPCVTGSAIAPSTRMKRLCTNQPLFILQKTFAPSKQTPSNFQRVIPFVTLKGALRHQMCKSGATRAKNEQAQFNAPEQKYAWHEKLAVASISVVTLIRTDTTLDHSQKAEKVCQS